MRIPERLQPLVEDGLVQEVVQPLMSGKEAMLFVVHANGGYCVAKVYKDAAHRSFRHRAGYAEGRRVRNSRQRRAMEKGTKYGKAQLETAWQNAEVDALYRLSEAGVRVPKPHLYSEGVLLMDLILNAEGDPAPRLVDVDLTEEQALAVHQFLVHQVVLMLCEGLVHGDLSECNVLLAWDGPVIIDLPQATDAAHNPNAMNLFVRDVENFTRYLARFAPELTETRYGREIWSLFERSMLFPDTVLTGVWKDSTRKADTRAVLEEIEDAAREAQAKRIREGDTRPLQGRRPAAQQPKPPPPKRPTGIRQPDSVGAAKPEGRTNTGKPAAVNRGGSPPAAEGRPRQPEKQESRPRPSESRGGPPPRPTVRPPAPANRGGSGGPPPKKPSAHTDSDLDLDDLDALLSTSPPPRRR